MCGAPKSSLRPSRAEQQFWSTGGGGDGGDGDGGGDGGGEAGGKGASEELITVAAEKG